MRCMIFGLGAMGISVARLLVANGATIVVACSRTRHVGSTLRDVIDAGAADVMIRTTSDIDIRPGMADIAVFCTTGRPRDLLAEARDCLLAGINVITLAEGALYPWTYDPETANALHQAALQGGATLTASGFQDGIMTHMLGALTSAHPSATSIDFHAFNDFSELGAGSATRMQIGALPEDFNPNFTAAGADNRPPMSTTAQIVEAIAALLDLGIPQLNYSLAPVVAEGEIALPHFRVAAGRVAGITETVAGRTPEGIEITGRLTAKMFEPGDVDFFSCEIRGPCPSSLRVSPTYSIEGTAATLVNRIPDVIAAPVGYLTVDRLPAPRLQRPARFR